MLKHVFALVVFVVIPAAFWGFLAGVIVNPTLGYVAALVFAIVGLDVCLRPSDNERKLWDAIERPGS